MTMARQSGKIGKLPTPYIVTGRIRGVYGKYLPSQGQGIHPWVRCESLRVQTPGTAPSLPLRLLASVMSVMSVIFYCWYFDVILTRRHRLTTTDTTDTPDSLRAHAFCQLFTVAEKLPENRWCRRNLCWN